MAAISNTDSLARVYREAFQRYKNLHDDGKLSDEHFELIKGQNTIEEVLYAVGKAKTQNKSERKAVHRVLRKTSKNLVGKLSRFESVVTTAIQSNPDVSALVWGGVRFILMIARDIFETYKSVCDLVLKITCALERFHDYAEIYPDRINMLLEQRLVRFYDSILAFCIQATTFYLQRSFRRVISSLRKSVSEEFSKLSTKLDSYAEEIHKAAETEHMRKTSQVFAQLIGAAAPPASKAPSLFSYSESAVHYWTVPYGRNRLFTGRKNTVLQIEKLAGDTGHRRIALYGLGGVGKTQIALECAYRRQGQHNIFWVHASGRSKFSQDFRKIADVGLRGQNSDTKEEQILGRAKQWLESTESGEWILFLDNADDLSDFAGNHSDISQFIPQGPKGTIIVTTRSRQVASRLNCEAIPITAMDVDEAVQLFAQRCPQYKSAKDVEAVSTLLESLDYLPLAVVGATSFIVEMDTSPSEYLELLNSTKQTRQRLLSTEFNDIHREVSEGSGGDMTESVLSTYFITFKQIERQLPLAADILRLSAFLDRQGIPEELLAKSELDGISDKVLIRKAIGKLVDFSLITRAEGGEIFALHRLVHLSIEKYLSLEETKGWRLKALELVSREFPQNAEYDNRHICASYFPHALAVTHNCDDPISASLLGRMGWHLKLEGDYKNAELYCRRSVALRETVDKNCHDTLKSLNDLAVVLKNQGRCKEAEPLYRRVLKVYETALGPNHLYTLTSVNNFASALENQGKYEEAEQMYRRALEGRESELGPNHPDTLTSGSGVALVLKRQGKSDQAEPMYRRALEGYEKQFGPDHPYTLSSINNLASVQQDQGRYEEAQMLYIRALEGRERVLGPNHSDTLTSISGVALVLERQGKYDQAEQMYRQALEGRERVLGLNHPDTLTSVSGVALGLMRHEKYELAEPMYRRALEGYLKDLGPDHPYSLTSMWCMADLYKRQRRFTEANDVYERASTGFIKALGNQHPHTVNCLRQWHEMIGELEASGDIAADSEDRCDY